MPQLQYLPCLKINGCRGCSTSCGCGCGDDDTCPAVDVNPWRVHRYQEYAVANWATTPGLIGADGDALDPARLRPYCDACLPVGILPATPDDATTPAPWFDTTRPDLTSGGFGWIIHDITVQHPRERERLTSKLDQLGCTLDGRRAISVVLEAVGTTPPAARHMRDYFIHRVVQGGQRRCNQSCGGSTVELWQDGYQLDGGTGRRLLTDVRGWIDSEIDLAFSEYTPVTACGVMFQIEASAADLIIEPDRDIANLTGMWSPLKQQFPDPLPVTQAVTTTTTTRKNELFVDLQLLPDGTLRSCPNDFDVATINAATAAQTHFRVSSVESIPETASEQEVEELTQLEITMVVADDGTITYEPAQPDLWPAFLADIAINGIDPDAPPVILTIERSNDDFDPTCPTCPESIRAPACADDTGVMLTSGGFLDMAGMGQSGATFDVFNWDNAPAVALPAWVDTLLAYFECLGYPSNPANVLAAGIASGTAYTSVDVWVYSDGRVTMSPVVTPGATNTLTSDRVFMWDVPGINYIGSVPDGTNATATAVTSFEAAADCAVELPAKCLPRERITPTGNGGPVVTLTVDPGTGVITSDLNLKTNSPLNTVFQWEPSTPPVTVTGTDIPGCDAFIPAEPEVTIDIGAGEWTAVGWTPGQGFPRGMAPEQFVITATEYGTNNGDPIVTTGTELQEIADTTCDCVGPCANNIEASGTVDPPDACWPTTLDPERRLWLSQPLDVSSSTDYQAVLAIEAGTTALEGVVAYIVADDGDNATGSRSYPLRIKELAAGERIELRRDQLVHVSADGKECDGADWVDAITCGWDSPLIDCSTTVNLVVDYPWNATTALPPDPTLSLQAVSSV